MAPFVFTNETRKMTKVDPHFHLNILGSARLKVKVIPHLKGYTVGTWLKHNGITCNPRKVETPSDWRISYGVLRRFANALGTSVDKLYKELTA